MVYYLHNRKTRLQTVVTYHATIYFLPENIYICIRRKEKSMKSLTQKIVTFASVLGAVALLAGCTTNCPDKRHHVNSIFIFD